MISQKNVCIGGYNHCFMLIRNIYLIMISVQILFKHHQYSTFNTLCYSQFIISSPLFICSPQSIIHSPKSIFFNQLIFTIISLRRHRNVSTDVIFLCLAFVTLRVVKKGVVKLCLISVWSGLNLDYANTIVNTF